jgi:monovalent cation/hydrogen antiporter
MGIFELTITLLLVGAVLSLLADRLCVPYPALLALAGAALALIPGTPQVALDPRLALVLFVAPVLLDAAFDTSPRDLGRNVVAVSSLALLAVAATIATVACVARHLVPDLGWAAAITLGAIVAPPDTSAATAVLRRLRPPHRLVIILQGESLFNDASALLVYRVAVTAATTGAISAWTIAPMFLLTCGGGVVMGYLLARLYLWATTRIEDIPVSVILQFIGTFAVWLLAERLGLSAILTVIAYGMTLGRHAPGRLGARRRLSSYAVWEVAVFVMNVLAFVMIGLQLRGIVLRMQGSDKALYIACAAAVCATVVVTRLGWVLLYNTIACWVTEHVSRGKRAMTIPSGGGSLIVGWCGMRGIVTLAAALALPDGEGAAAFPYRDLIVLCAFCVVLTTLVLQGMTLRPLLVWLRLKDDGSVELELQLARAETARAALGVLDGQPSRPIIDELRRGYEARLRMNNESAAEAPQPPAHPELTHIQDRVVAAQRSALLDLRARWVIGDDAFHAAEEEIDLLELAADERIRLQD